MPPQDLGLNDPKYIQIYSLSGWGLTYPSEKYEIQWEG
jgi:hypothetical protein